MVGPHEKPDWGALYSVAEAQEGHFTTQQAAATGFSTQLLYKHIHAGRVAKDRRGVYRLVHFPPGEHEELAIVWLWSDRVGIFCNQSALGLHGLSDVMPATLHLALPESWRARRLRVTARVTNHNSENAPSERAWFGPVPATSVKRTLIDCADAHLAPDLLRQATRQALHRGLVARADLAPIDRALAPFGGVGA
jgi:predicted transcriptional regulator of viral defense system